MSQTTSTLNNVSNLEYLADAILNTVNIKNRIVKNIYQFKILKPFDINKFIQDE